MEAFIIVCTFAEVVDYDKEQEKQAGAVMNAWSVVLHVIILFQTCCGSSWNVVDIYTVNWEIFVCTKFQISDFRAQTFSDTSQPSINCRHHNFPVLNFLLMRGITSHLSKIKLVHSWSP